MTRADVEEIARTVKYKPGWIITVTSLDYGALAGPGAVEVWLRWTAPDAYGSGENIQSQMLEIILGVDHIERGMFIELLFSLLMRAEHHEAAEFFMVGGKRPMDPHANRARELLQ